MAKNVSKSGVYIDTKTGKVVESQPEEGRLIVPPGAEISDDLASHIEAAKTAATAATAPERKAKKDSK